MSDSSASMTEEGSLTFHEGIRSMPGGTSCTFSDQGLTFARYWTPTVRPLPHASEEELREELLPLFRNAVRCRTENESPGVFLSGGLDSSSVAAVAAQAIAPNPLPCFTAVVPTEGLPDLRDERKWSSEMQRFPNVQINWVDGKGRGPFDGILEDSELSFYPARSSRFYLTEALEDEAVSMGCSMILSGHMGELTMSYSGDRRLLLLAMQFRWMELIRELRRSRTTSREPAWKIFARQVREALRTTRPASLVYLNPGFVRSAGIRAAHRELWSGDYFRNDYNVLRFLSRHAGRRATNVRGDLRKSSPYLDYRILEFCLSIPWEGRYRGGINRRILRDTMKGVLPEAIRLRTDKTAFAPDYYNRYAAQIGRAREFVASIRPSDPVREIIDVKRLTEAVTASPESVRGPVARDFVPRTIYLISFLRLFSQFRC